MIYEYYLFALENLEIYLLNKKNNLLYKEDYKIKIPLLGKKTYKVLSIAAFICQIFGDNNALYYFKIGYIFIDDISIL